MEIDSARRGGGLMYVDMDDGGVEQVYVVYSTNNCSMEIEAKEGKKVRYLCSMTQARIERATSHWFQNLLERKRRRRASATGSVSTVYRT
jgi:hypothetical protein